MEGGAFEPKKQGERFALAKEQFFGHGNRPPFVKVRKNVHKRSKAEKQSTSAFLFRSSSFLCLVFFKQKKLVRPPSLTQFPRESNQGRRSLPHIFLVYVSLKRRLAALRWKIEAVFSRMKNFRSIKCTYRHKLQFHRLIFMTLVAVYNTDVTFHPLKK